ncbi:MAG: hypothetical protein MSJ26_06260 [Oscillospiraceae bacterium]|nr:hypothetical protein [Oscillospiraceae bacterium]
MEKNDLTSEEEERRDRYFRENYGMSYEEFQEKYPPLDDMEFMSLYIGSKKYVDNSFRN